MNRKVDHRYDLAGTRLVAFLVCAWGLSMVWTPWTPAAGVVSVRVSSGGNLVVRGDAEANSIVIEPSATLGEVEVRGLDSTLVNGGESATFSGVTADFLITMRGGSDTVTIEGNQAPDDVEIDTGDGDDTVVIRDLTIPDDLLIRTGSGNDKVTLRQGIADVQTVSDKTEIRTNSGNDEVYLEAEGDTARLVLNDLDLRTGSGRDYVSISGAVLKDDVEVDLGDGDDQGGADGPPGGLRVRNATFEANDIMDEVEFDGGDGEDQWAIESVTGIAPVGVLDDFVDDFELEVDVAGAQAARGPGAAFQPAFSALGDRDRVQVPLRSGGSAVPAPLRSR